MSEGEMAYLAMVLTVFAAFIGVLGFVSNWSRRKADQEPAKNADPVYPRNQEPGVLRKAS